MTNTLLTLHDPAAARRYYDAGLWRNDTLYTLLCDHASRRPDDYALRDGTRRLTWRALLALVDAVAADLNAAGLKRGERVAVWLPNRVEAVAVLLAARLILPVAAASFSDPTSMKDATEQLREAGVQRVALAPCVIGPEFSQADVAAVAAESGLEAARLLGAHPAIGQLTAMRYGAALQDPQLASVVGAARVPGSAGMPGSANLPGLAGLPGSATLPA